MILRHSLSDVYQCLTVAFTCAPVHIQWIYCRLVLLVRTRTSMSDFAWRYCLFFNDLINRKLWKRKPNLQTSRQLKNQQQRESVWARLLLPKWRKSRQDGGKVGSMAKSIGKMAADWCTCNVLAIVILWMPAAAFTCKIWGDSWSPVIVCDVICTLTTCCVQIIVFTRVLVCYMYFVRCRCSLLIDVLELVPNLGCCCYP